SNGSFLDFAKAPYTDPYLIPFDEFIISAIGAGMQNVALTVNSSAYINNSTPTPVVSAYVQGASYLEGLQIFLSNSTYTLYINSTYNNAAGPYAPNQQVTVSVSLGNVSVSSVNTGTSGSVVIKYSAPNVSSAQTVTLVMSINGANYTQSFYLLPKPYVSPTPVKTVTTTKTVSAIPAYLWGLLGVFIILTVIFAVLFATTRSGRKKMEEEEEKK
ncbi:MAG: hypothetical protein QXP70_05185, partial [Methanomassiliicoccales archaeon]